MKELIVLLLTAMLVENFVLSKFLGVCPFLGVSKKLSTAFGMSSAVIFVMTIASGFSWITNKYILNKYNIEYLQTIVFVFIIAAIVQFLEILIKKLIPSLYKSLGIYLPLITTNCAVLGVALINIDRNYSFINSLVYGFSAGLGFMLAMILFSGIREKLEYSDVPEELKGLPIALISAALVSVAFFGFQGIFSK